MDQSENHIPEEEIHDIDVIQLWEEEDLEQMEQWISDSSDEEEDITAEIYLEDIDTWDEVDLTEMEEDSECSVAIEEISTESNDGGEEDLCVEVELASNGIQQLQLENGPPDCILEMVDVEEIPFDGEPDEMEEEWECAVVIEEITTEGNNGGEGGSWGEVELTTNGLEQLQLEHDSLDCSLEIADLVEISIDVDPNGLDLQDQDDSAAEATLGNNNEGEVASNGDTGATSSDPAQKKNSAQAPVPVQINNGGAVDSWNDLDIVYNNVQFIYRSHPQQPNMQ